MCRCLFDTASAACGAVGVGLYAGVAGLGLAVAVFHECDNERHDTEFVTPSFWVLILVIVPV